MAKARTDSVPVSVDAVTQNKLNRDGIQELAKRNAWLFQ